MIRTEIVSADERARDSLAHCAGPDRPVSSRYPRNRRVTIGASADRPSMAYRTTIGWSLITSGVVTLLLEYLPYPSVYWGIGLLVLGILVFVTRRIY